VALVIDAFEHDKYQYHHDKEQGERHPEISTAELVPGPCRSLMEPKKPTCQRRRKHNQQADCQDLAYEGNWIHIRGGCATGKRWVRQ